ncbi:hypothetical protein ES708_25518 [subsurface metagenome]
MGAQFLFHVGADADDVLHPAKRPPVEVKVIASGQAAPRRVKGRLPMVHPVNRHDGGKAGVLAARAPMGVLRMHDVRRQGAERLGHPAMGSEILPQREPNPPRAGHLVQGQRRLLDHAVFLKGRGRHEIVHVGPVPLGQHLRQPAADEVRRERVGAEHIGSDHRDAHGSRGQGAAYLFSIRWRRHWLTRCSRMQCRSSTCP